MNRNILKIIIFANVLLLAGQFFLSSKRATDGEQISKLDNQLSLLDQENTLLKNMIYEHSSISSIYSRSQNLKFSPVKVAFFAPLSVASAGDLSNQEQSNP